jgi:hypothetical protein
VLSIKGEQISCGIEWGVESEERVFETIRVTALYGRMLTGFVQKNQEIVYHAS